MKKLLMLVCLLSAGLMASCTKTSTETTNAANQAAATPAATATPTPAPVAGTNADDEMYKAVEAPECRMYLASIKVVSDCKSITQAERDRFSELHTKTLESVKKPLAGPAMSKARAEICMQTNNGLQKLVSQCKGK